MRAIRARETSTNKRVSDSSERGELAGGAFTLADTTSNTALGVAPGLGRGALRVRQISSPGTSRPRLNSMPVGRSVDPFGERAVTLDWTAISTISELVGAAAVVVTLGYVAVQIRQSTHAILANSRQTLLDADLALISTFITHAIDPHLIGDEVKLTPEDERRFIIVAVLYGAGGRYVRHRACEGRSKLLHGKSGIRAGAR